MHSSRSTTRRVLASLGCLLGLIAGCVAEGPATAAPSASAVAAKLVKGMTGADVRRLLGAPAATKEIRAAGLVGEAWSYPFPASPEVRMVPIATQQLPATNPLTGQAITRTETVYQNQEFEVTDTVHLLIIAERLVEWSVVRTEKKRFQ